MNHWFAAEDLCIAGCSNWIKDLQGVPSLQTAPCLFWQDGRTSLSQLFSNLNSAQLYPAKHCTAVGFPLFSTKSTYFPRAFRAAISKAWKIVSEADTSCISFHLTWTSKGSSPCRRRYGTWALNRQASPSQVWRVFKRINWYSVTVLEKEKYAERKSRNSKASNLWMSVDAFFLISSASCPCQHLHQPLPNRMPKLQVRPLKTSSSLDSLYSLHSLRVAGSCETFITLRHGFNMFWKIMESTGIQWNNHLACCGVRSLYSHPTSD